MIVKRLVSEIKIRRTGIKMQREKAKFINSIMSTMDESDYMSNSTAYFSIEWLKKKFLK